ncbi:Oleoyl-acyl carrier protein thioesterase, chloroplastic-like protein [Drosera capensis]
MLKPPPPPLSSSSSLTPSSSTVHPTAESPAPRRSFPGAAALFSPSLASLGSNSADLAVISKKESANGAAATTTKMIPLANQLRLGSWTEDGLSYKESFIVRSYEVGINKTATVETIANLLQEVGCNHAQSVGYSTDGFATTPMMRKLYLIWVTARMHIEIYRYPAWSDMVEIETWRLTDGRMGTRRGFILEDYANGEVIRRATSKWVMMNQDTRWLQRIGISSGNKSTKKITKLEDPAEYSKLGFVPRRADLDMNQHLNNVTQIGWILESIPQKSLIRMSCRVSTWTTGESVSMTI